uniref:Uncharacterized protein n=1 Tax=Setaria viridis TaxID=4556 RepID=A0A4U6V3H4_SETVI|nr:hypothetical protein SEVIR_4G164600v2 [Setaria viridis]
MPVDGRRGASQPRVVPHPPPPSSPDGRMVADHRWVAPPADRRGTGHPPPPLSSLPRMTELQHGPPPPRRQSPPTSIGSTSNSTAAGSSANSTPSMSDSSPIRAGAPASLVPAAAASPPPIGAPCRRPRMELCVIPRMVEVVANEIALECALVTVVIGSRPETSSADVHAYLMGHFGVELRSFMVHPHYPEDFLVMFRDANAMMQVMHAQPWLSTAALKTVSFPEVDAPVGKELSCEVDSMVATPPAAMPTQACTLAATRGSAQAVEPDLPTPAFQTQFDGYLEAVEVAWTGLHPVADLLRTIDHLLREIAKGLKRWSAKAVGSIRTQIQVAKEVIFG